MKKTAFLIISIFGVISLTACQKSEENSLNNILNDARASITDTESAKDSAGTNDIQPGNNSAQPKDNSTQPETNSSQPEADSSQPENNSMQSENNTPGPEEVSISYTGKYNDYDCDEPNLYIQKQDDGTYAIQIGIFRLASMDDCTGRETENGIEFTVNDWDWGNGVISGIITLDGDIATVTFTAGWNDSPSEYKYHKTSDVPD